MKAENKTGSLSVLYIDEDAALLERGKMLLERSWGFAVATCASPGDAVEILSRKHIDAIVSDYRMPEMDSIRLLQHLRQHGDTTPSIIFTGNGCEDTAIEALNSGADFYIKREGGVEEQFSRLADAVRSTLLRRQAVEGPRKGRERSPGMPPQEIAGDLNEVCYILDENANIVYISPNIEDIGGYPPASVIGRPYIDFVHPADRKERLPRFESVLSGSGTSAEYRILRADGGSVWVKTTAHPFIREGCVAGIQGTLTDITSLKRMEGALRAVEERYRDLAENAPIAILSCDRRGRITYVNRRGLEILDSPGAEETCRINLLTFPPLVQIGFSGLLRETIDSGRSIPPFDREYLTKWGKKAHFRVHISPILNQETVTGARIILDDISEQKKAEFALKNANKKLHLLSEITRHDILNSIMVVRGNLEFAMEMSVDPVQAGYLEKVEAAARAIQQQIEFTRAYGLLGVKEPVWLSLGSLIEKIDEKRIPVVCTCPDVSIYADPLVERVFSNLMDNTVRHADGASVVRVRCSKADHGLRILWEDDGQGIPDDQKELIFKRGYGKNSGFGLFLAREILAITGIGVTETGQSGKGARFEILVPEGGYRLA